jgi:hypothetical protein
MIGEKISGAVGSLMAGLAVLGSSSEPVQAQALSPQELVSLRENIIVAQGAQKLMDEWRLSKEAGGYITYGGGIRILQYTKGAESVAFRLAEGGRGKDDGLMVSVTNSDGSMDIAFLTNKASSPDVNVDVKLVHVPAPVRKR